MNPSNGLLLSYYGDDFTGSTDVMESLTRSGLRTVLFLRPPTPDQLRRFEGVRAVGMAGVGRALSPAEMDAELGQAFRQLKSLDTPIVHYKTCSTFDSSPQIGSIGHAIDLGQAIFGSPVVPLVVGAPVLGRYCVFGNLFARSGLESEPYRLDRHPTMRHHPITPMDESDLRLHLAKQTAKKIALFDALAISLPRDQAEERLQALIKDGAEVVLFDVLYDEHLPVIGRLIQGQVRAGSPLFVAGSSGVEYALTAHWRSEGLLPPPGRLAAGAVERLLVISGSCSPVTDRQIGWAVEHGAHEVAVRSERLVDPPQAKAEIEAAVRSAATGLAAGRSVIVHSCRGPQDPRLAATVAQFQGMGHNALGVRLRSGKVLGGALGAILVRILEQRRVQRIAITGGDTSGYIARTAGIEALEMIAPLAPGSPLCRIHAPATPLDGLEITFKGGQVGKVDFFATVANPNEKQES